MANLVLARGCDDFGSGGVDLCSRLSFLPVKRWIASQELAMTWMGLGLRGPKLVGSYEVGSGLGGGAFGGAAAFLAVLAGGGGFGFGFRAAAGGA